MSYAWRVVIFMLTSTTPLALSNLLIPGIMTERIALSPKTSEYIGFLQSAVNETEVEIRIRCPKLVDVEFDIQFVIRTSPCAKEFIVDRNRFSQVNNLLAFYFEEADKIPSGYHYDQILYYMSKVQKILCAQQNGDDLFMMNVNDVMKLHNVTSADQSTMFENKKKSEMTNNRVKRNLYPGLNRNSIDGGAKMSLTSWHPVQRLPVDAIYLLILKVTVTKYPEGNTSTHELETEVQWRGPNGYLSAIDYPLLHFYGVMWLFYAALAIIWLIVCLLHWRDLLRVQFWIGGVIVAGMIEKTVFYAEYSNMNTTGRSVEGLLEFGELVSCLKRTIAHVLVIIVSVGFGVVKPRLGSTMNQVLAVGVCYFLFCSLEGLARVSKQPTDAVKEQQIAKLPLAFLEIVIAWWIFSSLINTMRVLHMRKNTIKLELYRNFTNVLAVALTVSIFYMIWSLYMHAQYCMMNWQKLWIDTAFWHVFFSAILLAIVILWRPSRNNQRYAFTPLLDDSEDDNDEEIFNSMQAGIYRMVKQRSAVASNVATSLDAMPPSLSNNKDDRLQDDLKWIEHNIPASFAEALVDEDEEHELRHLEISKML